MNLDELTVKFNNHSAAKLIEEWKWLIGDDKTPIIVSAIGDMFLMDRNERIHWLNVGSGELTLIAHNQKDFEAKLENEKQRNEWFLTELTRELMNSIKKLEAGKVFSFKLLPILGGKYTASNFKPLDIEQHFGYLGSLHKQLHDLPDGTKANVKITD